MFRYPTIIWEDKLFLVKRKIRESHQPIIDKWKTELDVDTVLRKDGFVWFCEEIEEVDIIETTPWEEEES